MLKVKSNQWKTGDRVREHIMVPGNWPVGKSGPIRVEFWVLPATEGRQRLSRHDGNSAGTLREPGQLTPTPHPLLYLGCA